MDFRKHQLNNVVSHCRNRNCVAEVPPTLTSKQFVIVGASNTVIIGAASISARKMGIRNELCAIGRHIASATNVHTHLEPINVTEGCGVSIITDAITIAIKPLGGITWERILIVVVAISITVRIAIVTDTVAIQVRPLCRIGREHVGIVSNAIFITVQPLS